MTHWDEYCKAYIRADETLVAKKGMGKRAAAKQATAEFNVPLLAHLSHHGPVRGGATWLATNQAWSPAHPQRVH